MIIQRISNALFCQDVHYTALVEVYLESIFSVYFIPGIPGIY